MVGEISMVSYRRGDYVIDVEQDNDPESFSVVFIWDSQ